MATEIFVQVDVGRGGVLPQGAKEDLIKATREKLKEVTDVIKASWSELAEGMKSMPYPPSEFDLEFGVDVGAEGGVPFITKGSIGANFKISLTWRADGK